MLITLIFVKGVNDNKKLNTFLYLCAMAQTITLTLTPKQAADSKFYTSAVAKQMGVKQSDIALLRIVKRSVDARRGALKVNLTLEAFLDFEPMPEPIHFDYPNVENGDPIIIIGAGPAGLFAALRLIELGKKPILFERGKDVAERGKDIAQIQRGGAIDPDSNYAFGEGGAGTFSDGKLFTRSKKRGDYNRALQRLVYHGATEEILYEAHPHIGSDRLPRIIADIRRQIVECGGEFFFNSRVTSVIIKDGRAVGVVVGGQRIEGCAVIVATGHSAHDIYNMLDQSGVRLEAKPFAMGVRIEHPQALINKIQYHCGFAHTGDQLAYTWSGALCPKQMHRKAGVVSAGDNGQQKYQYPHAAQPVAEAAPVKQPLGQSLHIRQNGGAGGGEAGDDLKKRIDVIGNLPGYKEGG